MIEKRTLDNGVTLLCEPIEHVKSASIAVWIDTAPPVEWRRECGVRHFIEHLVFKGTKKRTGKEIAQAIDRIGGTLDAWTDHEATTFFTKVLDRHFDVGLDILSDLVISPLLREEDFELERKVILDEILKETNDPTSNAIDQYLADAWPNHPYGMMMLGAQRVISRMPVETARRYYQENYVGKNVVLGCSGRVDPNAFFQVASEYFRGLAAGDGSRSDAISEPEYVSSRKVYVRKFDHINLCLGLKAMPYDNPYRYEFAVLDTLLGSGLSSRLFQEIREKHGLCYSIVSFAVRRKKGGLFAIHSATAPKRVKRLLTLIMEQLRSLVKDGAGAEETDAAKEQLKGSLMLALESTSARVLRLAREYVYFGRIFSLDEICAGVDAVTPDSVNELTRKLFSESELGATIVGNLDDPVLDKIDLSVI